VSVGGWFAQLFCCLFLGNIKVKVSVPSLKSLTNFYNPNPNLNPGKMLLSVVRVHDIYMRIRICETIPLERRSGFFSGTWSGSCLQWLSSSVADQLYQYVLGSGSDSRRLINIQLVNHRQSPINIIFVSVLRIRFLNLVAFFTPDPGSGWVKSQDPEWTRIIFRELRNHFLCLNTSVLLCACIRDGKIRIRDPGWKKFGSGIQDKHPGSATLICFV
jgi:hypothetical protein